MIRTWGFQAIVTGGVQPWFGDTLAAAFSNVQQPNGFYFVPVANAAQYQIGDRIILGFGSAGANVLLVGAINTTTNILSCTSEGNAPVSNWVVSTIIALDIACYGIQIQAAEANGNPIYIGADKTVTSSGGGSAFYELYNVSSAQPASWSLFKYDGQNPLRTTEGWVAGTATQKFAVAAFIN